MKKVEAFQELITLGNRIEELGINWWEIKDQDEHLPAIQYANQHRATHGVIEMESTKAFKKFMRTIRADKAVAAVEFYRAIVEAYNEKEAEEIEHQQHSLIEKDREFRESITLMLTTANPVELHWIDNNKDEIGFGMNGGEFKITPDYSVYKRHGAEKLEDIYWELTGLAGYMIKEQLEEEIVASECEVHNDAFEIIHISYKDEAYKIYEKNGVVMKYHFLDQKWRGVTLDGHKIIAALRKLDKIRF